MPWNWTTKAHVLKRACTFAACVERARSCSFPLINSTKRTLCSKTLLVPHSRGLRTWPNRVPFSTAAASKPFASIPMDEESHINEPVALAAGYHPPNIQHPAFSPSTSLSPAQISRAASQTIRLAILNNEIKNAVYVVNSLRHSQRRNAPPGTIPTVVFHDFAPIDFGQKVSHRLAAHCLLHGLLRQGYTHKASKQARLMIEDGIQIRSTTLQAIFGGLRDSASPPTAKPDPAPMLDFLHATEVRPKAIADPSTRFAVHLLLLAREYRHHRSDRMFRAIIDATLLQGHVIFASLLIVYVVKDWQAHNARMAAAEFAEKDASQPTERLAGGHMAPKLPAFSPSPASMVALLSQIQSVFDDPAISASDPSTLAAMQALAHLVSLLADGSLPFSSISALIRAVYSCPRAPSVQVWVRKDEAWQRVMAYDYMHDILYGLAKHPPNSLPDERDPNNPYSKLRRLDRRSYNALIHYAMRHRLDIGVAQRLLGHLTTPRRGPRADVTTYNIIMRASSLVRRNDVAESVIARFAKTKSNTPIFAGHPEALSTSPTSRHHIGNAGFEGRIKALLAEPFNLSGDVARPLVADDYTVSSYISYLTTTGKPGLVAPLLFRLIPELHIIDHPSWIDVPPEQRQALRKLSRRRSLERAIIYGPFFFTSVLNALQKSGRTGLAERVWLLAKEAERASWVLSRSQDVQPWCLPIQAYTSMMNCYAAEARKGIAALHYTQKMRAAHGVRYTTDGNGVGPKHAHVRGWARLATKADNHIENTIYRHDGAERMATLLLRDMWSGAMAVYDSLLSIQQSDMSDQTVRNFTCGLTPPIPDARFFNAALDLFTRHDQRRTFGRAYWRKRLRFRQRRYAKCGQLPRRPHPIVRELAEHMDSMGLPIPLGIQSYLAGRWATLDGEDLAECRNIFAPYSFPQVRLHHFQSHKVGVHKAKGLPIRQRPSGNRQRCYFAESGH